MPNFPFVHALTSVSQLLECSLTSWLFCGDYSLSGLFLPLASPGAAVKVEIHVTVNTSGGPSSAKTSPTPPLTPSGSAVHSPSAATSPGQTSMLAPSTAHSLPSSGCTLQKTLSDLKKHRTDLRASINRSSYCTALENGAYPAVSPATTGQLFFCCWMNHVAFSSIHFLPCYSHPCLLKNALPKVCSVPPFRLPKVLNTTRHQNMLHPEFNMFLSSLRIRSRFVVYCLSYTEYLRTIFRSCYIWDIFLSKIGLP